MTKPDNAHDAAVERVADALADVLGHTFTDGKMREAAEAAIAAYKQGLVTDETLWAEYKAKRADERRSVYGATARAE